MHTPTTTTDHADAPAPGACPCKPWKLCPACMGRLQRFRHEAELQRFASEFGAAPRAAVRERPRLRLVK